MLSICNDQRSLLLLPRVVNRGNQLLTFFGKHISSYRSLEDPLTRLDPVHPSMPSRLNPLRGSVHGAIEGLGPVPFVQPLCKHLHRPLGNRDLPSAFICALVHRRERTRGCRWCFPKSVSVAENCGNCQLLLLVQLSPGPSFVGVAVNLALSPAEAQGG